MILVHYTDETPLEPFLVLDETEDTFVLGLREYPDVEQDYHTNKDEVVVIDKDSIDYVKALEIINSKL